MRTAFLGTSELAAAVLRRLADSEHRPALVVTPPARPRGRGLKPGSPPAAEVAEELGIELLQAERVNEDRVLEAVRDARAEAIVVCAFGQLIRDPLLSETMMLNVHPSLLPRWRGAAPIERAIMAGDERTGVSVMRVTEGLDSGPVALQRETRIGADEGIDDLEPRLAELGAELIVGALDLVAQGKLEFRDQEEEGATYAEKITPAERHLDPARPAAELERVVRALGPRLGTYIELGDRDRLGVRSATALAAGPPEGEIEASDGLLLGCSAGALRLDTVQPPGGREMSAEAFLRGHRIPARAADERTPPGEGG